MIDSKKKIQFVNTRRNSFTIDDLAEIISNRDKKMYIFSCIVDNWGVFSRFFKSQLRDIAEYVPIIDIKPTAWKRFEDIKIEFNGQSHKRKLNEI